jgi:hypothetical protein
MSRYGLWKCELCWFFGDLKKTAASTLRGRHTGSRLLLLWGPAKDALGEFLFFF